MSENNILTYKGKPLVRKDNVICYGDAKKDRYVLTLTIRETKRENGFDAASNVLILVQSSDPGAKDSAVKYGVKETLYAAFEIGEIWLESFLKQ